MTVVPGDLVLLGGYTMLRRNAVIAGGVYLIPVRGLAMIIAKGKDPETFHPVLYIMSLDKDLPVWLGQGELGDVARGAQAMNPYREPSHPPLELTIPECDVVVQHDTFVLATPEHPVIINGVEYTQPCVIPRGTRFPARKQCSCR